MATISRKIILDGITLLLLPIARFCLRRDVKIQDFVECAKRAFLQVGHEEISATGVESSTSRLSVITGLHRPDVRRLSSTTLDDHARSIPTRILGHWQSDKRFLSKAGRPKSLKIEGENSEFVELVRAVSKDINPYTVLFELERSQSVERLSNGKIKLTSGVYVPAGDLKQGFVFMSRDCHDLISSVEENLFSPATVPNLHISTEYDNISRDDLDEIREWLLEQGTLFHENAQTYLSQFDLDVHPRPHTEQRPMRVAVCAFSCINEASTRQEEKN